MESALASAAVVSRILGIDPGSVVMGYAIIEQDQSRLRYIASGCLRLPAGALPQRLHSIYAVSYTHLTLPTTPYV